MVGIVAEMFKIETFYIAQIIASQGSLLEGRLARAGLGNNIIDLV